MMSSCRICRSEKNLKFSLKELRRINKRQENNSKDLSHAFPATTTGNICFDCEERLHNFNKHIGEDSDVDVDCSLVSVREDSPVIVDDDELLYNLFFNKHSNGIIGSNQQTNITQQREFTQHSLGSDGDAEIIEVLNSSRESTPSLTFNGNIYNASKHLMPQVNIGNGSANEVIDLELDDESESDHEEIVFRRVAKDKPTIVIDSNVNEGIRRKRKRLADNETTLVASLSLLSSDSEAEVEELQNKTVRTNTPSPEVYACSICHLNFIDPLALQRHQFTHSMISCPVCNAHFALNQRLVQHMRTKHRSYSGETLKERPKCALDSAMTIRLRFLQRHTYYECQLCGQIDAVFKDHKEHVITQHAAESKSLRDPMMKELKCPICKTSCGTQHLALCEHLRLVHKDDHSEHLKEVEPVHPFGWSIERQRDVEDTARIFQFFARKGRYFECTSCSKVTVGYFNHWKHLTGRSCEALANKKLENKQSPKAENKKRNERVTEHAGSRKRNTEAKVTKKIELKKTLPNSTAKTKNKLEREVKKPETSPKIGNKSKQSKLSKISGKTKLKTGTLAKVNVKPRLVQFLTQDYTCKYCTLSFKGFYALNVHQIKIHALGGYQTCNECNKVCTIAATQRSGQELKNDKNICHLCGNHLRCRHHRRKCRALPHMTSNNKPATDIEQEDANSSISCKQSSLYITTKTEDSSENIGQYQENNWFQELMQFSRRSERSSGRFAPRTVQCEYCTRLFSKNDDLFLHEQQHVKKKEIKMIKFETRLYLNPKQQH